MFQLSAIIIATCDTCITLTLRDNTAPTPFRRCVDDQLEEVSSLNQRSEIVSQIVMDIDCEASGK